MGIGKCGAATAGWKHNSLDQDSNALAEQRPQTRWKLEITQHPHLDGTDYSSVYTGCKIKMRPSEIQTV